MNFQNIITFNSVTFVTPVSGRCDNRSMNAPTALNKQPGFSFTLVTI